MLAALAVGAWPGFSVVSGVPSAWKPATATCWVEPTVIRPASVSAPSEGETAKSATSVMCEGLVSCVAVPPVPKLGSSAPLGVKRARPRR